MTFWEFIFNLFLCAIEHCYIIVVLVSLNCLFNKKERNKLKLWIKQTIFSLTSNLYRNIIKEIKKVHYEL